MNAQIDELHPYCDCHYKHQSQITDLKGADDLSRVDRSDIWKVLDTKVNMKMFYLLIAIFIGTFSFQLLVYNSIRTVETDIAVLKAEMRHHKIDETGVIK